MLLAGRRGRKNSSKRAHRHGQAFLGLMLMLTMLLLLVSCGGAGTPQPHTVGGTPSGTYLVSVVGTDPNHNPVVVATIPLNVQ